MEVEIRKVRYETDKVQEEMKREEKLALQAIEDAN